MVIFNIINIMINRIIIEMNILTYVHQNEHTVKKVIQ